MTDTVLASNDCFTKGRGFAPAGASAASIVAAKGRSFRLTRSAFSLSPLARRRPLETFGAVFLLLCFNAAQHNTVFILND